MSHLCPVDLFNYAEQCMTFAQHFDISNILLIYTSHLKCAYCITETFLLLLFFITIIIFIFISCRCRVTLYTAINCYYYYYYYYYY